MIQGTQTSESLGNAPVYQVTQAGHVEEVEIGALLPTKSASSLFVATPVSENPPVRFTDRVVDVPVVAQRHVPSAPRVQKIVEMSVVQFSDGHVDMPGVTQRQVPMIQRVQKIVEVPQIQYVDKIVDAPVVASHQPVPADAKTLRVEAVPDGTQTVSRKRKISMETESADGTSDAEHGLVQEEECRSEVDETRERDAAGEGLNLLQVAPDMEDLQATTEDKERLVDWTQDLHEIRQMVEFLVRRERKLDAKADVAVRRLDGWRRSTPSKKTRNTKLASLTPSRTGRKLSSLLSTSGSSTKASALEKSPQAKSSSSTPALSEVPKSS